MALFQYPGSAAMSLNNLASLGGSDDDKPKKPALYRAGRAVGTGLNAAHQVAAAGDMAADRAINAGVDATKLGVTNFVRGVQGQPALDALPTPAPAANDPVSGNAALTRPTPVFNPSIDQLKANGALPSFAPAGQLPVAPKLRRPDGSGIDTGVTLPDGRTLPYGSMVNGVPTFSDGSGGVAGHPSSIPRTMTDADIQGLGARLNVVPAATLTRAAPAFNSDNSDANVAAILRSRQGDKFGVTPEMTANANLAAVTNQDARTTLGRAALNASRRAGGATTTLQRKQALDDLAGLETAVRGNAAQGIQDAGALARTQAEAGSVLQRQALANQGDLARQGLANEGDLARTDLAGQYDVAGRLAQGQARTSLTDKDVNDEALKIWPRVLGLDQTTGMIADKSAPGGMRQPTQQEIAAAIQQSKAIIQKQLAPTAGAGNGSPYSEGTRLRGPDGKTYVVKNGVPVVAP